MNEFPTDYKAIIQRLKDIKPNEYVRNRNFIDGNVTYLSPYISRGVISTKQVLSFLIEEGFELDKIEKFVQELAWRDYFQQNWITLEERINEDIKNTQEPIDSQLMPTAVLEASTGIETIDEQIEDLYNNGYMHNHTRMYVSALTCNVANAHWKLPAKWMYYHLLDGDWGSNALSWQWVAGSNSNKKYIANQENINKYCYSDQSGTFLDVSYEELNSINKPMVFSKYMDLNLETKLPKPDSISINNEIPTALYTYYNLDPNWHTQKKTNKILILEPSFFKAYPVSEKCIDFMIGLSKNIKDIQVYVGEFDQLYPKIKNQDIYYKEHPFNDHFKGIEESRDWMSNVKGYNKSFFSFWKKCKKELKNA